MVINNLATSTRVEILHNNTANSSIRILLVILTGLSLGVLSYYNLEILYSYGSWCLRMLTPVGEEIKHSFVWIYENFLIYLYNTLRRNLLINNPNIWGRLVELMISIGWLFGGLY